MVSSSPSARAAAALLRFTSGHRHHHSIITVAATTTAMSRRSFRRPRPAWYSTQQEGSGQVSTPIVKPPSPPPPLPLPPQPHEEDDDLLPFKISKLWLAAIGIGAFSLWVFGGDKPAAYDKPLPKANKPQTIDVAYIAGTYQGNQHLEDRFSVRETMEGDIFAGVFDGHGGWSAAFWSSRMLSHILENEMANETSDNPDEVVRALARAFERADRTLLHYFFLGVIFGFPSFARVGACAIALFIRGRDLFVANAGDCRAIMGKRRTDGTLAVIPLSRDHNARFEREKEALRQAHPGEDDVVVCTHPDVCYIKNRTQATRTLGDAYLKCAEFNGRAGGRGAGRRYIPPPYTPPYIRATPEVVHVALDDPRVKGGEFVVLGTDGLYDALTNEEVITTVAKAIDDGVPEEAPDRLIARALEVIAGANWMSVDALKAIPPGNKRRNYHDDITIVVTFLQPQLLAKSSTRYAEGLQLVRLETKGR